MKYKLLASILFALLFTGILTAGLNISRVSADQATLYIDPSNVPEAPANVGSTFTVSVKISSVTDLFGFDINITWDNTLITFSSLDNTTLNPIFGNWFEPLNGSQTGVGYVRFAAVKTGLPGFTGSGTLFTLTFNIVKGDNFPHVTSIAFGTVKLSDSNANEIPATKTPCSYTMSAIVPDIDFVLVNPNTAKQYEYGKYFEIQVYATHVNSTLTGYDLKVDYTSDLLAFYGMYGAPWGAPGTGTLDTSTQGVVHVSNSSGTPTTGDSILLFTLTFEVKFDNSTGHIWRTGSPQSLVATVSLDTTYGDLSFSEGTLNVDGTGPTIINLSSTINLTILLIKGDVTCDGQVNINDLRTVAAFYDLSVPPAPAQCDLKTDGAIDIYDLVLVASNFLYSVPDSPPS